MRNCDHKVGLYLNVRCFKTIKSNSRKYYTVDSNLFNKHLDWYTSPEDDMMFAKCSYTKGMSNQYWRKE